MKNYDVIWIGTGQATGTVIPRLVKAGKTVALVEGGRYGGSCVNYGCTPTKTLVASARAAHMARRGADFGVQTGAIEIDFQKVMGRMNDMRDEASSGLENWLCGLDGVTSYRDYGLFEGPNSIRVGKEVISGDTIIIHAGGRSRPVPIDGLDDVSWVDNVGLLALQEKPDHLIILGGSYIGLEFSQVFRRLGSRVTVLERGAQLMFREDEDIAAETLKILTGEGIDVCLEATTSRVEQDSDGQITVHFKHQGEEKQVSGSHLLLAVGRQPNSDRLNLAAAGVEANERGFIPVNDVMRTNVPHIYALGDINGAGAFTHTSVNDGEIFWDHYSGDGDRRLSDRETTYAMFIDPPLGRVGMNEKEARQSGKNVLMAKRKMKHISRAREKSETDGLVKLFVDGDTDRFLGATILGVGGDEIVNMFTVFMASGQPFQAFRKAVLVHPTVAELMPWILDDLKPLK